MTNYDHRREIDELGSWIVAGRLHEIEHAFRHLSTILSPDDWTIASTWENDLEPFGKGGWHWLKLQAALEQVDPNNHTKIDKIFAEYVRAKALVDEPLLAERARLIGENRYGWRNSDDTDGSGLRLLIDFGRREYDAAHYQREPPKQHRVTLH